MLNLKEEYYIYDPLLRLEDNCKTEKTIILLMDYLRQKDYMISKGYSYELTVQSFLTQLMTNEGLRPLQEKKELVVLLNEEGALIREDQNWKLYFRPETVEGNSLDENMDLFSVYQHLLSCHEEGSVCSIELSQESVTAAIFRRSRISILDEYCRQYPGGYLAAARKIVQEGTKELFSSVPSCCYGNLTSVDLNEIESYRTIKLLLDDYIYQVDHKSEGKNLQPLSIAVFGAPGSGKSFGVKEIAKCSGRFQTFTLNLSQYSVIHEVFEALDQALSSVKDGIPLYYDRNM